ncbi:hypothetical protein PSAC2689_10084 [Paraburkholderia sacchari]
MPANIQRAEYGPNPPAREHPFDAFDGMVAHLRHAIPGFNANFLQRTGSTSNVVKQLRLTCARCAADNCSDVRAAPPVTLKELCEIHGHRASFYGGRLVSPDYRFTASRIQSSS